ncbi:ATP-binding protein [Nocardioides antri]|uniref:Sensor-like histidine kinase SenX3 n=1 Tax=Nocardioides antri TaxID=2607659 RepID=A0A5B1M8N7_9ACTN|nr:ATP-binding protein [Nocardioides antri]KAA1429422.1 hypothetical protein F0U47_04355 [Nocardioides antri]
MRIGDVDAVGKRAALVAVYLAASLVGRASVIDSDPMALVWPAGGLVVAWLVTRPTVREWLVDIPLIALAGAAVLLLTGTDGPAVGVLATSNLVGVLTVVLALRRWSPTSIARGAPPLRTPQATLGFLGAVIVGSFVGVASGGAGLLLAGFDVSATDLLVWFGRNVCGITAVGVTALLILDHVRRGRRTDDPAIAWPELAALFAATGALIAGDYLTDVPVSFLLPAAVVWAGSRFPPLAVAVHALTGGAGILWLTYVGSGPFAGPADERAEILLAQLFIAMTLVVGLLLAAAREERASMSHELQTFARRVAHDLRNPISVVESWTTELAATLAADPAGPPPGAPRMVAGIERATAHMRHLVDALLADASARDRATTPAVVDLAELVEDVAEEYGAADRVRSDGVRSVSGDPVLLRQLVDNLVGNALKYARPDEPPDIAVSARHTADRVVVRVTDNGVGIPSGAHEWIFEPFRRAHDDTYPGTGLGLSTCRRIVERHGGSMRALSREDAPGTVFEFDLPPALATTPA